MNLPKRIHLPPLPYHYDGLEPVTSAAALKIHYQGHHKGYVDNYNKMLKDGGSKIDMEFNYSGHLLHTHFWESFTPLQTSPGDETMKLLRWRYQRNPIGNFVEELIAKAMNIQGSGWVIALLYRGNIEVISIANHDLRNVVYGTPLLVLDAWEHAFYLDYQNNKSKFFDKIVDLINWNNLEAKLTQS